MSLIAYNMDDMFSSPGAHWTKESGMHEESVSTVPGDDQAVSMPTTKGVGGTVSSRSQRYRPASEYDDATLAQKREYWRTKKREQRAKLSKKRERPKSTNRASKLSVNNTVHGPPTSMVLNSSASRSIAVSGPPLLNSDGSYQMDAGDTSISFSKGNVSALSHHRNHNRGEGEHTEVAGQNQKERWFQRIKLNKVLPQFQVSNAGPEKGSVVCKTVKCSPAGGAMSGTVTSAKPNGALLNSGSSVPQVRVTVRPSGPGPRQPQGGIIFLNGSSSVVSTQQHLATCGASGPNVLNTSPVTVHIQPITLTTIAKGMNITTSQSAPLLVHRPGARGANTTQLGGKKSYLVRAPGVRDISETSAMPESEEGRAAKRREQWRIKKREQRAKQAVRLAKGRERTQSVEVAMQRAGHPASMVPERPPSTLSRDGQRQCGSRVRTPFTSAGRLLKNARAVAASCSVTKHASIIVKKEYEESQSSVAKLTPVNHNQLSSQLNVGTQTGMSSSLIGFKLSGEPSRRLPGHIQFSIASRGIARSKTQRQRLIETQRNFLDQRSIRKSPCHATAFTTRNSPREDPLESPEQRAARKREYWRVKKREQRAKLSVEVKAKMKERDALMRRVKRYQSILQEMRKARTAGCNTVPQPTGNTVTSASETIGGFIKEDGTVTINIPQVSCDRRMAATGGDIHTFPTTNTNTHQQFQPLPSPISDASRNVVLVNHIRVNPPPPPLHQAQVKITCPPLGMSITKPPRLVSVRPRAPFYNTHENLTSSHTVVQPQSHISLSHPQSVQNTFPSVPMAGPKPASCVMQMTFTGSAASSSALNLGPELTEEERMAKKREYWRVKKREQRAARAARLKQALLQARGNTATQRKPARKVNPNVNTSVNHTLNVKPLSNTSVSIVSQSNEIKQEEESTTVDPCPQSEQPVCVDIKPPLSLSPPPPEPQPQQPEPDPALSADSQATTLLAVASMKKLLEESLSTVTDCGEQTDCKTEQLPCKNEPEAFISEEATELEVKPNLPLLSLEDEKVPIAGDLSLEVKSWHMDDDAQTSFQTSTHPLSPNPRDSPLSSEAPSLVPSCPVALSLQAPSLPLSEPSHTTTHSCTHTAASSSLPLPLPRRAQRLRAKRAGQHHCCSPEPPKLHHQPLHPQQQLQHQQQASNLLIIKTQRPGQRGGGFSPQVTPSLQPSTTPFLQPGSPSVFGAHASLTTVTNIPTLLVVSPNTSNTGQPSDTLELKPPINCNTISNSALGQQDDMVVGSPQTSLSFSSVSHPAGVDVTLPPLSEGKEGRLLLVESQQEVAPDSRPDSPRVRKWRLQVQETTNTDTVLTPTLTPPDNPLSSIKLLPIQPSTQTSSFNPTQCVIKYPTTQTPLSRNVPSPAMQGLSKSPIGPPKPIPGESEEETLRRKREYWRVKKKEQRARKAMKDRDLTQKRASVNWRTILPAQDMQEGLETQEQEAGQWTNSSEDSDLLLSSSTDLGYFPNSSHMEPIEDEAELLFPDADGDEDGLSGGPISDALWRNRYLMDHDPLNQLLVCMVCGELQYSHSLEGVRAHIEEAHPDTLTLEPPERRHILEAWDEQVSRRERFFTSQLQQHSGALTGDNANLPAEVEVVVDTEESSHLKNNVSKTKVTKRL